MKLRMKIIYGFGIVLSLLVLTGIVALIQFSSSSRGFTDYRHLARDTNLAGRLQANMLMVRLNVKDFIITGNEKNYHAYQNYMETMNSFLSESQAEIQQTDRAARIDDISREVLEYEAAFKQVHEYRIQRDSEVQDYLNIYGPIQEELLSEILNSAEADGDMTAAFYTAIATKHLLLGRLYIAKFLDENLQEYVDRAILDFKKLDEALIILDREIQNPERRQTLSKVINSKNIYLSHFENLVNITFSSNHIIETELDRIGPDIASWAEEVKLSVKNDQDILGPKVQASNSRANIVIAIILVLALGAGAGIAYFTINSVLMQLGADPSDLQEISKAIAEGDLRTFEDKSIVNNKTIGIYNSMLEMKEKLTDIVSFTLNSAEQIAMSSEQLASGNQDLSRRTEKQASDLEKTSSAIEEMNFSIKSNAENTEKATQLSADALDKTKMGAQAVEQMVHSMDEINTSSNKISDIIEVINNIAFQTNLLALNASIEAARAGEQGKGFAVVAVEVRKLAKRSDRAASQISQIISSSNTKVSEGVEIANTAGSMLKEINTAMRKVSEFIGEISAASQEQLVNVDNINSMLRSLDENTQNNAALVEEAASSTEELSSNAQEFNSNMQFFKIDNNSILPGGSKS